MPNTIIKRVGGKVKMAGWIKKNLPPHSIYVEPFGGSFAVGFCLPRPDGSRYRIVYNDLDRHVWNFFRVLRERPSDLVRALELTPYGRSDFENAIKFIEEEDVSVREIDPVEWARNYVVYNRQSIFGKETGTWCIARQGENISSTWNDLPPLVSSMARHLKTAFIECLDYRKLLKKWDSPQTTFYFDPPYLNVEQDFYHVNKKSGFDHKAMRKALGSVKGSWAVSYYDSDFIRDLYSGFEFRSLSVVKHMQRGKKDSAAEVLIVHYSSWSKEEDSATGDCFEDHQE